MSAGGWACCDPGAGYTPLARGFGAHRKTARSTAERAKKHHASPAKPSHRTTSATAPTRQERRRHLCPEREDHPCLDTDPEVLRAVDGQKRAVAASYRDPEAAADALDALIKKSGNDLRVVAQELRQDGPEVLGDLCGREGWLASQAAKTERTYARNAARTIPASLDQQASARDASVAKAVRLYNARGDCGKDRRSSWATRPDAGQVPARATIMRRARRHRRWRWLLRHLPIVWRFLT
jgi:hypothetical protein